MSREFCSQHSVAFYFPHTTAIIQCRQRNSDIVSQLVALYPVELLIIPSIVTVLNSACCCHRTKRICDVFLPSLSRFPRLLFPATIPCIIVFSKPLCNLSLVTHIGAADYTGDPYSVPQASSLSTEHYQNSLRPTVVIASEYEKRINALVVSVTSFVRHSFSYGQRRMIHKLWGPTIHLLLSEISNTQQRMHRT